MGDLAEARAAEDSADQDAILAVPIEERVVVPTSRLQDWWKTVRKTASEDKTSKDKINSSCMSTLCDNIKLWIPPTRKFLF